jgi:hypothetical protein
MAPAGTMMYNEYGDLVDAKKIAPVVDSRTMDATKMIRLIHLNFHHLVRHLLFLVSQYHNLMKGYSSNAAWARSLTPW